MCIILADKSEGVLKAVDAPPYKKKKDVNIPVNTLSTSLNKLNNTVVGNLFLPQFSHQFSMPNYYLYPRLTPRNPLADLGNGGWNTRPPKRAPAKPSFFALQIHSNATRPIVPEDNTDLVAQLQNHRRPIGHRGH
ncbi:UNVERIFIED_CONTAM: hypothetical protein FKN15_023843 [Acipenser sinensis]